MSKVLVTDSYLSNIAAAIRSKLGVATTYKPSEMSAAIASIPTGITPTGTVNITQNGTTDVTQYASANVQVPNTYAAADEGKVVSNGALVAQTARATEITQNGTYDTTLNDEVTVNVQGGGETEPALPSEYQRVVYLDFTPSIGILITLPTSGTILYTCDFVNESSSNEEGIVFGYRQSTSNAKDFELGTDSYGSEIISWVRTPSLTAGFGLGDHNSYTTGNRVVIKIVLISPRSEAMIGKYAKYSGSGVDPIALDGKFYSLKGTNMDTDQIAAWFVPCYRKADNQVGVYDHIAQAFYYETYAVGSGYSIVAGPDVA